jgi:hypothetical protein
MADNSWTLPTSIDSMVIYFQRPPYEFLGATRQARDNAISVSDRTMISKERRTSYLTLKNCIANANLGSISIYYPPWVKNTVTVCILFIVGPMTRRLSIVTSGQPSARPAIFPFPVSTWQHQTSLPVHCTLQRSQIA